jgi:DNA polymerase-1
MMAPIVGMTKMTLFDEVKVREKYDLEPWQIVDYKGLVGDASDNYPGVSGIGPKTAATLLNKYNTLEGVYEHLSELSPQIQLKLANDAEQAALAKKLATIIVDAPIKFDENEAEIEKIDNQALKKVFEKLGFKSLLNRVAKDSPKTKVDAAKAEIKAKKENDQDEQLGLL